MNFHFPDVFDLWIDSDPKNWTLNVLDLEQAFGLPLCLWILLELIVGHAKPPLIVVVVQLHQLLDLSCRYDALLVAKHTVNLPHALFADHLLIISSLIVETSIIH